MRELRSSKNKGRYAGTKNLTLQNLPLIIDVSEKLLSSISSGITSGKSIFSIPIAIGQEIDQLLR